MTDQTYRVAIPTVGVAGFPCQVAKATAEAMIAALAEVTPTGPVTVEGHDMPKAHVVLSFTAASNTDTP
jgi:thioesterase domain-containing protein